MLVWSACALALAAGEPIGSFRCNKAAFYPTAGAFKDRPGGTRRVLIPETMCASVATGHDLMEALCCANTHVNCSAAVTAPTLISYDGTHFALTGAERRTPSTAASWSPLMSATVSP